MPTGPYQVTCQRNNPPNAEFDSAKLLVKSSRVGGGGGSRTLFPQDKSLSVNSFWNLQNARKSTMLGVSTNFVQKPRFVQKCRRILDSSLYVRSVQVLRTAVRGATAPGLLISILHRWSRCAENLRRPARGPPPSVRFSNFESPSLSQIIATFF